MWQYVFVSRPKNRRERRAAARATNGVALSLVSPLGLDPVSPPPPVRAPERLETQWSPQPTISRWIAQTTNGELTWSQLDSYRRQAELGLTEGWGDLTRRFLATDDHVFSCYRTYVAAVSGARREVMAPSVDPSLQHIADEQAETCAKMLDNIQNPERSIGLLLDADFTGYAVSEILWSESAGYLWPYALEWLHPDRVRFSQQFQPYLWDRGVAALRAKELGVEFAPVDDKGRPIATADLNSRDLNGLGLSLPANKYIVHIPQILPNYPQGSGIFLSIMRPWWVKNWVLKYALAGAEVAGNPRMLGHLPTNAPAEVRQALYDALQSIASDTVGVVAGETTIELLDAKLQGYGSIWDFILKWADAAISKAILGSTLNVEVGDSGGNRSLGESQADVTIAPRWNASATLVGNTLTEQLFRPFLTLNRHMWDGHVFVPKLRLHISEDEPRITDKAVDAGVVTRDELRRACRLEPLGADRGGDELIPAITAPGDATVMKAQIDARTQAQTPGGAAPPPFPKLTAARAARLTALAKRLR